MAATSAALAVTLVTPAAATATEQQPALRQTVDPMGEGSGEHLVVPGVVSSKPSRPETMATATAAAGLASLQRRPEAPRWLNQESPGSHEQVAAGAGSARASASAPFALPGRSLGSVSPRMTAPVKWASGMTR